MLYRTVAALLAILPLATCQFTSPSTDAVLTTGDKVKVAYTTSLKNYTIALWQRAGNASRPKLGSVVYATTNGPSSSFSWTVQAYGLDLTASQTFFFWLFEGDSSHQGNDPHQISSSYFNITGKNSKTSLSAVESSQTTPASSAPSPPPPPDSASSNGELSTGARVGIGAAVSVFLLAVILLVLFLRHRAKKGSDAEALRGGTGTEYTNSIAELQSECVSHTPVQKLPVYKPVPGDAESYPSLAELEA
ncbi:hypothetical protein ED733_003967 [Metarhizium rileyi]|uniref:Uncharacterized protein n=1 Tax=Metarhizium rileyi (strain RCEF 4871) TaxID=1649241 RepID=A0A5C6G7B7_METRR|nr:hypothetical protein ED733_003967 [Metarhizium rileyi]